MNRPFAAFCVVLSGLAIGCGKVGKDPAGPAADVPELQVLNHWLGKWEDEMTVKPDANLPNGGRSKGTSVAEWIHDGHFMRQTWEMDVTEGIPKMSGTIIMTYDSRKKTYRSWSFFSNGFTRESQGAWDAASKTMTWSNRDEETGRSSVTKATFTDGTENWSVVDKDRDGNVVSESHGKNVRKKGG